MTTLDYNADHYTCRYCQYRSTSVEAGGIWHCPNVLCSGPGATGWRSANLKSFKTVGSQYEVDPRELYDEGMQYASDVEVSHPELAAAIRRSSVVWLTLINDFILPVPQCSTP